MIAVKSYLVLFTMRDGVLAEVGFESLFGI